MILSKLSGGIYLKDSLSLNIKMSDCTALDQRNVRQPLFCTGHERTTTLPALFVAMKPEGTQACQYVSIG
jgi:hypothetical protein